MDSGPGGTSSSALKVLRAANDEIEALRRGGLAAPETRGLILRVANAVDRSLRRVLRDDEAADLSIRLRSLAPDELATDVVLAELRRNDRLPMELAAGIHELFEVRRRLESGAEPSDAERLRSVRVADLLEREIQSLGATGALTAAATPGHEPLDEIHPVTERRPRRRGASPAWLGLILLAALIAAGAFWFFGRRDTTRIEQGVALFRSGDYEEAAQHFWRYAEENPDDATPHIYLARIHRRMNRPDLAADAIRAAETIDPDDPAVHSELGFLLLDTGNPDRAVGRFEVAIDLDESWSDAWVGLARALRESGRAAEADSVLARAPADVRALLPRSGGN